MIDVAWQRAVSVTVGVLWAAVLSRFWWPAQARRELGKALGELSSHILSVGQHTHMIVYQLLSQRWMVIHEVRLCCHVLPNFALMLVCYKARRVLFVCPGDAGPHGQRRHLDGKITIAIENSQYEAEQFHP